MVENNNNFDFCICREYYLGAFLKAYFYMPRPFIYLPAERVKQLDIETDFSSFPSGHTCFAMLMVVGLWPVLGRVGKIIAVIYLFTIAFSRIALGVHFPADVVISMILSLVSVCIVRKAVQKFEKIGAGKKSPASRG